MRWSTLTLSSAFGVPVAFVAIEYVASRSTYPNGIPLNLCPEHEALWGPATVAMGIATAVLGLAGAVLARRDAQGARLFLRVVLGLFGGVVGCGLVWVGLMGRLTCS